MYLNLQWLSFPVNLKMVDVWFRSNAGASYTGSFTDDNYFHPNFLDQPSDEILEAVQSYWAGLTSDSEEATTYQSRDQINAAAATEKAAALASAQAKLEVLGLTADEIAAILGA